MTKKKPFTDHPAEALPQIIRGVVGIDPNINRRPIFIPDKRARKRDLVYVYEKEENHNGCTEKIVWKVFASPQYGNPTVLDQDVLFALYKVLNNKGFVRINDQDWLAVSCYEIIRVLGRKIAISWPWFVVGTATLLPSLILNDIFARQKNSQKSS